MATKLLIYYDSNWQLTQVVRASKDKEGASTRVVTMHRKVMTNKDAHR